MVKKKAIILNLKEKRNLLDSSSEFSIREQCDLLGLASSTYYYSAIPYSVEDESLMALIDEHYLSSPHEGKIKRARWLTKKVGYAVGKRRVKSLMKTMGLETVYPKPNTSAPNKEHEVFPYLLREMNIDKPEQVWSSDITYC